MSRPVRPRPLCASVSCRLFQQFVISGIQAVPNPAELRTGDMLYPSLDLHQCLPRHIHILKLDHPNQFRLSDSPAQPDPAYISAYINARPLLYLLFHRTPSERTGTGPFSSIIFVSSDMMGLISVLSEIMVFFPEAPHRWCSGRPLSRRAVLW